MQHKSLQKGGIKRGISGSDVKEFPKPNFLQLFFSSTHGHRHFPSSWLSLLLYLHEKISRQRPFHANAFPVNLPAASRFSAHPFNATSKITHAIINATKPMVTVYMNIGLS